MQGINQKRMKGEMSDVFIVQIMIFLRLHTLDR